MINYILEWDHIVTLGYVDILFFLPTSMWIHPVINGHIIVILLLIMIINNTLGMFFRLVAWFCRVSKDKDQLLVAGVKPHSHSLSVKRGITIAGFLPLFLYLIF